MKYSKKLHDWVRENKSVIVKVMGEADNPGVFHAYSLAEIANILLDEIERLREQTIDYENNIFLGQTIEYWIRIKAQLDADNSDQLVREILLLKAELARRDEERADMLTKNKELHGLYAEQVNKRVCLEGKGDNEMSGTPHIVIDVKNLDEVKTEINALRAELARRDEIIRRLKEAGENLIQLANFGNKKAIEYTDLWSALMKELEG